MAEKIEDALAEAIAGVRGGYSTIDEELARRPEVRSELEPLLVLGTAIAAPVDAVPSPAFQARTRAGLMHTISSDPVTKRSILRSLCWNHPFRQRRLNMSTALAIVLTLVLMASGGAAFAAQGSAPGDLLYPVRMGIEQMTGANQQTAPETSSPRTVDPAEMMRPVTVTIPGPTARMSDTVPQMMAFVVTGTTPISTTRPMTTMLDAMSQMVAPVMTGTTSVGMMPSTTMPSAMPSPMAPMQSTMPTTMSGMTSLSPASPAGGMHTSTPSTSTAPTTPMVSSPQPQPSPSSNSMPNMNTVPAGTTSMMGSGGTSSGSKGSGGMSSGGMKR